MINPDYSWIPFHVVACTSEDFGTSVELIATQPFTTNRSWESSRTASFPQEIVLRFHTRCEVNHLIISTKLDRNIPEVEFHVGDGLSGSFLDVEYRLAGKAYNLSESQTQVKLNGFGSFLKIKFLQPPKRSHKNLFGQVSIGSLKIWGRFSGYHNGMKNDEIPLAKDTSEVEKVLIGMGIPLDLLAWFEEGERNFEYAPIDEDTRLTIKDLDEKRDKARLKEDYEGLKQLTEDIKKIFDLGREIWSLQKDLEFALAQENFDKAMEIKARLKKLIEKRDSYDALYETSRYENMIIMKRPTTAEILAAQNRLDDEQAAERERRRRELEEQERRRILEEEQRRQQLDAQKGIKDNGEGAWWEKNQGADLGRNKKKKEEKKKKDEDVIDVGFNNPFAWNEGDVDLDLYFRPLLANAGEKLKDIPLEVLRRLQHLGYLNVFGARLWTAAYSENWRIREAAAQAVLNFLEMPILEKYLNGKSRRLFLSALEVAKIACEDKLLQIYFIGLKILSTALAPPICGKDVTPQIVNKAIKEFLPILIEKISELNFRARDISLHTLLSLFRHPAVEVGNLVVACMDICDFGDDIRPKNPIPIDKQQWRLLLARLEIILHVLQEFGYNPSAWNWQPVFQYLISPSFFHSNLDVRLLAIEVTASLYQFLGQDVRTAVSTIDNLKPNLLSQIHKRLDEIDHLLAQNQDLNKKVGAPLAKVDETNEEHTPPPSSDAKVRNNNGVPPFGQGKVDPKRTHSKSPPRQTKPKTPGQQVQQNPSPTESPVPQQQAQQSQPQSMPSGNNASPAQGEPQKDAPVAAPKKKKWGFF